MKQQLKLVHLYPSEMNIYGDRGNMLTLIQRLDWRDIETEVINIGLKDDFDFTTADIIFAGGGQDRGQGLVAADLGRRADNLKQAAKAGVVMLVICGTYQLFGRAFTTLEGEKLPGIGLFGAETFGSTERLIGNCVIESDYGRLVGFENHSGQTKLDSDQPALGKVLKGNGNNSLSGEEGARLNNVHGTYLHGPLLPKNPRLADHLLETALVRKYGPDVALAPLNDELEFQAARVAATRPQ
jgi:CobQ-like glutamine amidotransferase family enzyme